VVSSPVDKHTSKHVRALWLRLICNPHGSLNFEGCSSASQVLATLQGDTSAAAAFEVFGSVEAADTVRRHSNSRASSSSSGSKNGTHPQSSVRGARSSTTGGGLPSSDAHAHSTERPTSRQRMHAAQARSVGPPQQQQHSRPHRKGQVRAEGQKGSAAASTASQKRNRRARGAARHSMSSAGNEFGGGEWFVASGPFEDLFTGPFEDVDGGMRQRAGSSDSYSSDDDDGMFVFSNGEMEWSSDDNSDNDMDNWIDSVTLGGNPVQRRRRHRMVHQADADVYPF
jgi:hypothetical protein